jgi:adenine/guanine phosphoribosyltransferase-like PRPP-binding protein
MQWAGVQKDIVTVERKGKPFAAMVSYELVEEWRKLKKQELKQMMFEKLKRLRDKVIEGNPDLTQEDGYRLAGFSEELTKKMLANDKKLASTSK